MDRQPKGTTVTTPITYAQQQVLMASLNPERISNRKQGGSTLSYLEAWDVKATLIRVFGYGQFSADVVESKIERILTKAEAGGNANWVVLCSATVRLTIHQTGATYTETAVSSQAGAQIGEVADFAMKTAESDALKRAAIYLGTQFGLSLYDNGSKQDVIRRVFSPGQEWPRNPDPAPQQDVKEDAAAPAGPVNVVSQFAQPAPGVTPEQHQENLALMQRALSAKAAQSTPQQEFETAMELVPDRDEVPMALAGDRDE